MHVWSSIYLIIPVRVIKQKHPVIHKNKLTILSCPHKKHHLFNNNNSLNQILLFKLLTKKNLLNTIPLASTIISITKDHLSSKTIPIETKKTLSMKAVKLIRQDLMVQ